MVIHGHIQNGVVILDGQSPFPEGTAVAVTLRTPTPQPSEAPKSRLVFPLICSPFPGSVDLNKTFVDDLLNEEDAAGYLERSDVSP